MHFVSQNPQDTAALAARYAREWLAAMPGRTRALVIALSGELGAGKTTFTQGVAAELGVEGLPKSPTFTLIKEYAITGTPYRLVHMDCYRLQGHADLAPLDIASIWSDPHALVLVEWPERIGEALPADHIVVRLSHDGGDKRSLSVNANPARS